MRPRHRALLALAGLGLGLGLAAGGVAGAGPAAAQPVPAAAAVAAVPVAAVSVAAVSVAALPAAPVEPVAPVAPTAPAGPGGDISIGLPGSPSQVVQIIVLVTLLGVAPSILLMTTAFTKIVVVLSLTRSALGTPTVPPNQVLVGLALFLSLFVMGPTLDQMYDSGLKPYLDGRTTAGQAYERATPPLREFMLDHTRDEEIALMTKAAGDPLPEDREDADLRTLVPAFVLSELRGAFIIGFVIFVPFLVVDIVVAAILMSLGMVMLPPSLISLPFKILLFVLVDGWSLIVTTLLGSYS